MKVGSSRRVREPWRAKDPGELRVVFQSKTLNAMADSRAEKTLKTGALIASGSNVKKGKALETACCCVGGRKL